MDVEHVVGLFVRSDVTYIVGIPAQKNIFLTKAQEKIWNEELYLALPNLWVVI